MPVAVEKEKRDPPTHICSERGGAVVPVAIEKGTRDPLLMFAVREGGGECCL